MAFDVVYNTILGAGGIAGGAAAFYVGTSEVSGKEKQRYLNQFSEMEEEDLKWRIESTDLENYREDSLNSSARRLYDQMTNPSGHAMRKALVEMEEELNEEILEE